MLKSFMTVDPEFTGRGMGRDLRRRMVQEMASQSHPVLRFGESVPRVEEILASDYATGGLHLHSLGPCVPAAAMGQGGEAGAPLAERDFADGWGAHASAVVVDPAAHSSELGHYRRDPRGRTLIGVRDSNGELVVAAMAVRAALATRKGLETQVQLEQVLVQPNARAEHVGRLVADAAWWGYETKRGVVTIPNIGDTPWPVLAGAGFRRLSVRYSAWIATAEARHPLHSGRATNVEIV